MIKELPRNFTGTGEVKGFIFTQIAKGKKAYIYEVDVEGHLHYEVFEKKTTPVCIDFANRIYSETDTKVMYPKAKHFGYWAWTSRELKKAQERFLEIEHGKK